jgi:Trimethylamine methyltransferase (MTTB)
MGLSPTKKAQRAAGVTVPSPALRLLRHDAPLRQQCGAFHVIGRGLTLDENGFAMDAFREVGPGSHFLGSAHTLRN